MQEYLYLIAVSLWNALNTMQLGLNRFSFKKFPKINDPRFKLNLSRSSTFTGILGIYLIIQTRVCVTFFYVFHSTRKKTDF